jgi:hypothetical protein
MFFKRKPSASTHSLTDLVPRRHNTGFVFVDVMNDLGFAADDIGRSSKEALMAYGYARRTAAAALYVQGLIDEENFDHAVSIFKSLQVQTEHSIEFQEAASKASIEYLKHYSIAIDRMFVTKLLDIAFNYTIPEGQMSDEDLFAGVFDTLFKEQEDARSEGGASLESSSLQTSTPVIQVGSRALDGPAFEQGLADFRRELEELEARPTQKTYALSVIPCDGSLWSWNFELGEDEIAESDEVISRLYDFAQGWIQAPTFRKS